MNSWLLGVGIWSIVLLFICYVFHRMILRGEKQKQDIFRKVEAERRRSGTPAGTDFDRADLYRRDAIARGKNEELDGSPRRHAIPVNKQKPGYHGDPK